MTRAVTRYKRNIPAETSSMSIGTIAIIAIIALVIYFIWKKKTSSTAGQYKNLESWNVTYNQDGLPTKIEIHRDATRT